jgi:hypothetical protein
VDGGWLKVEEIDGMVPPPGPSDGARLSVLDGGAGTDARGPRFVSAGKAVASMRWLVKEWRRAGGADGEAMPVAAVGEQVRELLFEGRRIIYAGEERWPGAEAEELILAGDGLVVDLLEMEAMLGALVGTEKEAGEARRRAGMVRGYLAGKTLRSIGERYGVSWQRVQQVVARYAVRRMPLRRRACSVCGQWLYAGYTCHGHVEARSGLVLPEGGALAADLLPS